MFTRLRNVWHPENFHFQHRLARGGDFFEGWYFKLVDRAGAQPLAIIPGVFLGEDAHCFIQVLDGRLGSSQYHRFPMDEFRAAPGEFCIEIAGSRFTREGIRLSIGSEHSTPEQTLEGNLSFSRFRPWPVTPISPGVMGPYSFAPFMECNHGILSLDHRIDGSLKFAGVDVDFSGGRGYVEKDWGRSFPSGYVWTQSNHFPEEGVSLSASVARIPWLTGSFRGFLVGLLLEGELYRFTTYTGAQIESLTLSDTHVRLQLRDRKFRLEVDARKATGGILHAPYEKRMVERVAESMTSDVDVMFSHLKGGGVIYRGRGQHACLEVQGELEAILDA